MLKKRVESKKITVKKYKDTVTKMRGKMTISLTGYQQQVKEITESWKKGEISQTDYESKTVLLKKRLKTTLKVQKIR